MEALALQEVSPTSRHSSSGQPTEALAQDVRPHGVTPLPSGTRYPRGIRVALAVRYLRAVPAGLISFGSMLVSEIEHRSPMTPRRSSATARGL